MIITDEQCALALTVFENAERRRCGMKEGSMLTTRYHDPAAWLADDLKSMRLALEAALGGTQ